mmetsp:Transcript_72541/g.188249  ORF Transcript_72541/g.188249 Transcript_72541/m.188249 type:complete len:218 (-) Transcript_72541:16-669(-)
MEFCVVQRVDDDLGIVCSVLCNHLLVKSFSALFDGYDAHTVLRHVDDAILPVRRRGGLVQGLGRRGHWEAAAARAQRVVQAPAGRRVQLEGADFAHDGAVKAVVYVCRRSLDAYVGADVVGGDLIHVGGHAWYVQGHVSHPPHPPALQRHWQAPGLALGGGHEHARLEEAAPLDLEGEIIVAFTRNSAKQVVVRRYFMPCQPLPGNLLQLGAQLVQT